MTVRPSVPSQLALRARRVNLRWTPKGRCRCLSASMMPVAARVFELKIIPQLSKIASNFEKKACDRPPSPAENELLEPKKKVTYLL